MSALFISSSSSSPSLTHTHRHTHTHTHTHTTNLGRRLQARQLENAECDGEILDSFNEVVAFRIVDSDGSHADNTRVLKTNLMAESLEVLHFLLNFIGNSAICVHVREEEFTWW